jgi:ATP-binding cassette, subfamily B (MDR/TAP), member 1
MIIVVGFGGRMVAKSSRMAMMSYSAAATVAEEILSSVRTAQAFGTEDKLAVLYNGNLGSAQKAGIRKAFAMAFLLASLFSLRYLLYGLAFCISPLHG